MPNPNRYGCSVLDECRLALEKLNIFNVWLFKKQFSLLLEEVQIYGNRIEAALGDKSDLHHYHDEAKVLKAEIKDLRMQKEILEAELGELGTIQTKEYQIKYLHNKQTQLIREINDLQKMKNILCDDDDDELGYCELGELF